MSIDWFEKYLRQIRQMDKWLEPHRHLQDQMDKWLEPQRRLQEQMDKWLEPQRHLQDQMEKWLEPQRRLQEQMEKWLEPHRRLQDQMDKWLEPQRRLQEQTDKWLEHQWQFQENLNRWKQPLELEKFITNILSRTEYENITVTQSGMISVEGNTFSASEFSDTYTKLIESIQNLPSPVEVLNVIWGYLKKLKKPIAILLIIFILPFIINIIANLSTSYFENIILELTNKPKTEKIKAIMQEAQTDFAPDFLKEYRFVNATILKVRNGPSTKYQVVDEIHFGQVVHLFKKGRKWSSIEYTNEETDKKVTGYVFNRYLSKFRK